MGVLATVMKYILPVALSVALCYYLYTKIDLEAIKYEFARCNFWWIGVTLRRPGHTCSSGSSGVEYIRHLRCESAYTPSGRIVAHGLYSQTPGCPVYHGVRLNGLRPSGRYGDGAAADCGHVLYRPWRVHVVCRAVSSDLRRDAQCGQLAVDVVLCRGVLRSSAVAFYEPFAEQMGMLLHAALSGIFRIFVYRTSRHCVRVGGVCPVEHIDGHTKQRRPWALASGHNICSRSLRRGNEPGRRFRHDSVGVAEFFHSPAWTLRFRVDSARQAQAGWRKR